jgi:hypothetical protein
LPTALDNGRRSPRKLLRVLVARRKLGLGELGEDFAQLAGLPFAYSGAASMDLASASASARSHADRFVPSFNEIAAVAKGEA